MISEEQKLERKNYIGGSDCAAILGVSKYRTPLSVYLEKKGELITEDISDKICVKLGNKLEQAVAELFSEETGLEVRKANDTFFHKDFPFLAANIDRKITGERSGLEIKTTNSFSKKELSNGEIPNEWLCQCWHYMAVTGYEKWYLAILVGNNDFYIHVLHRDEELLSQLIKKEVNFWENYFLKDIRPAEMISDKDSETISRLFPRSIKNEIELNLDFYDSVKKIKTLEAKAKEIESTIEETKNKLKFALGENESGTLGDIKVSWKSQEKKSLDGNLVKEMAPEIYEKCIKTTSYRVMRIK